MEKDFLNKELELTTYVDLLPEVMQEIILAGYVEDGEWKRIVWQHDPVNLLANIRHSLQDLLRLIREEKSAKSLADVKMVSNWRM